MSAIVFFSLAPSPTPENLGAAVVANVAIIAVVTANSANELPFVLFRYRLIVLNISVLLFSYLPIYVQ